MVDWLVEVTSAYDRPDETFYLTLGIMDAYFQKQSRSQVLELSELHITGVSSLFLASKYEDVYPLLMRTIYEKIGHKKLSKNLILKKEQEILIAIGYNLNIVTTGHLLLAYTKLIESMLSKDDFTFFKSMCSYLGKMIAHDSNLQTQADPKIMASACLYVGIKITEQIKSKKILSKSLQAKLIELSCSDKKDLIVAAKLILKMA